MQISLMSKKKDVAADGRGLANMADNEERIDIPGELPILPLRGVVAYPQTIIPLIVGQPRSIRLVDAAVASGRTPLN